MTVEAHAPPGTDPAQMSDEQALAEIKSSIVGMLCTHCGGDGREPLPEIRTAWWPILLRLYRTRARREELQHARSPARMSRLYDLYDEMREIMEDAAAANIPQTMWMQAAGISRAQVSNIYRGKVGWPAVRENDRARVNG